MSNVLPIHDRIADAALGLCNVKLGRLAYALISTGCGFTANYVSLGRRDYDLRGLGDLCGFGPVPMVGLNLSESFVAPSDVIAPKADGGCVRVMWLAAINGLSSPAYLSFGGVGPDGPVLLGTTVADILQATTLAVGQGLHKHGFELELLAAIQSVT